MSMIRFTQVTDVAGVSYTGLSYGASWGDLNGDTYPDLWVNNHYDANPSLFLNQGDGTFTEVAEEVLQSVPAFDRHSPAWTDFDNDGDQDLVELSGGQSGIGEGDNKLYVNVDGILEDRGEQLGIDYPEARSRDLVLLDFNQDGLLDFFVGAKPRPDGQFPPTLFLQTDDGFENVRDTTGLNIDSRISSGMLADVSGDGHLDAVFRAGAQLYIYDVSQGTFEDITADLTQGMSSPNLRAEDVATGDFNGDGLVDLYLTRTGIASEIVQSDDDTIKARFNTQGGENGFKFDTNGNVSFTLRPFSSPPLEDKASKIYIGSQGLNPDDFGFTSPPGANILDFTLSPDDPNVEGIFEHTPVVDQGIYIGYNPTLQQWDVVVSTDDKLSFRGIIDSTESISNITANGFEADPEPTSDRLLINTGEGFVDRTNVSGIDGSSIAGSSVISADLDNDMDLDLYIVATGVAQNRSNILYENQGDGTFIEVEGAGGAEGTNLGVGDTATVADYDLDGFLDLFVTNGFGPPELASDGFNQLFRNQGNDNHWLQIDLQGTVSNRDGIGAQVRATAGGVTQLREQNGGMHAKVQNHQRLHFGLADNTKVQETTINWPSGRVQTVENLPADQLFQIIEIGGDTKDKITGSSRNEVISGGGGGDVLNGYGGKDYLNGNDGSDWITGGRGRDVLTGGEGNDVFVLQTGKGTDQITDFEDGQDVFKLRSGLTFEQLSIAQVNSNTQIRVADTSEVLATVLGIDTSFIGVEDFI